MKARWVRVAAVALVAASLACGAEQSATANNPPTLTPSGQSGGSSAGEITIARVIMYRDDGSGQPGDEVTIFKPSDRVMHFAVTARGLKTGQKVRLVFTGVDTTMGRDTFIAEAETGEVLAANQITGQVSLTEDWPTGSYKMDIYVDGRLVYTWGYEVEK